MRHESHYAPRPLQQPQMPDMKQIKHSVCNHIRHFSLLSYLPSAGNPSTQPQIRRLALPLIRSITQPNAHGSSYQPTTQSPSFHQPRHTLQTHFSPPPEPTGNSIRSHRPHAAPANTALFSMLLWRVSSRCSNIIWRFCDIFDLNLFRFQFANPRGNVTRTIP